MTSHLNLPVSTRRLKVSAVLDPEPFVALGQVPDGAPARTTLALHVAGRVLAADIATKSLRKAVAAVKELGSEGCAVVIQGVLNGSAITECGLSVQPKGGERAQ